jgi:hypothetical protein
VLRVFQEGVDVLRLPDAIRLYWQSHRKAGNPDFVTAVERDWNKLIAHAGDIPLQNLTREHARALIDHLAAEANKTTTIRRSLNHIKAVQRSGKRSWRKRIRSRHCRSQTKDKTPRLRQFRTARP